MTKTKPLAIFIQDPRDDDLQEDSALWTSLLRLAYERHGCRMTSMLRVFRLMRTRIVDRGGRLILVGEVDTPGGGGYRSVEEWQKERDEHLRPVASELKELLRELRASEQVLPVGPS